jgi:hypothetical protein
MLVTKDIEMQAHSNTCAHSAIINLFKLRALPPPSFDEVNAGLETVMRAVSGRNVIGDPESPTPVDTLHFLTAMGFVCALVGIPPACWQDPQKILQRFLNEGCHLLIYFNWRDPDTKEIVTHISLVEGYSEAGYRVIDGEPGFYPEGKLIELEPSALSDDETESFGLWLETHAHGSRRTLPFVSVGAGTPAGLGLLAHFLAIYPPENEV